MRFPILLMLSFFLFMTLCTSAQGKVVATKVNLQPNHYTLDKLPATWLGKPKVLKAIDDILPVAIAQLNNARSCMQCEADYTLSLKIDTIYIISQVDYKTALVEEGGLPYASSQDESRISFTYSSKLCVWNTDGQEVARLVVTEGTGETYHVQQGNFQKAGRHLFAPIVYVATGRVVVPNEILKAGALRNGPPLGTVPTEEELLEFTADKLVTMSKWIRNRKTED